MQALLILSLCATSLGGTGALTALYYYFSKPSREPALLSKAGRARRVAARRNALGRALDAASRRFDAPEPTERVLVQARPFEFSAFDE